MYDATEIIRSVVLIGRGSNENGVVDQKWIKELKRRRIVILSG
jgi:hypothetical protein